MYIIHIVVTALLFNLCTIMLINDNETDISINIICRVRNNIVIHKPRQPGFIMYIRCHGIYTKRKENLIEYW